MATAKFYLTFLSVCMGMGVYSFYSSNNSLSHDIETYRLDAFPSDKISLHMPCEESNMFATKCMCHIRCTHQSCMNAKKICKKYRDRGCKYMLTRGGANKIATLKRVPTAFEYDRFNISSYPTTSKGLSAEKWSKIMSEPSLGRSGPDLEALVKSSGVKGEKALSSIFALNLESGKPLCLAGTEHKSDQRTRLQGGETAWRKNFLSQSLALVVLNYNTPITLFNTMRTWKSTGLIHMVRERLAILNDPLPSEIAIALDHGFEVLQPKDILPIAKMAKPNVLTIGAAFHYALRRVQSEYVLFMEKDFKMDETLSREDIQSQLVTAAGLLDRGVGVVRLMSRKYQGCGTFKSCDHGGIDLLASDPVLRKRNWYAFYCPGHPNTAGSVDDCTMEPRFRCFTSWDSNWSLNAVMVKKSDMLRKKYPVPNDGGSSRTIPEIGLQQWEQQDGFEGAMTFGIQWMRWRLPICISHQGLFIHEEIETSA